MREWIKKNRKKICLISLLWLVCTVGFIYGLKWMAELPAIKDPPLIGYLCTLAAGVLFFGIPAWIVQCLFDPFTGSPFICYFNHLDKEVDELIYSIYIQKKEMDMINGMLQLTGLEIYAKYGYKPDEEIVHTALFRDGTQVDIKLVVCRNERPYLEAVLFQNGSERVCKKIHRYAGYHMFKYAGRKYIVNVSVPQE